MTVFASSELTCLNWRRLGHWVLTSTQALCNSSLPAVEPLEGLGASQTANGPQRESCVAAEGR